MLVAFSQFQTRPGPLAHPVKRTTALCVIVQPTVSQADPWGGVFTVGSWDGSGCPSPGGVTAAGLPALPCVAAQLRQGGDLPSVRVYSR